MQTEHFFIFAICGFEPWAGPRPGLQPAKVSKKKIFLAHDQLLRPHMFLGQFLTLNRLSWSKQTFGAHKLVIWAKTGSFDLILSVFDLFWPK